VGELESLETDEPLQLRRHRHWYDRLMMLTDGVFAIAITILTFDMTNPTGWRGDWAGLWSHFTPQLNAYAVSFLVIGIYWLAHRRFMAMILTVDAPVTVITLLILGEVALIPAATRLINGEYAFANARLVYAGLVVAIGATMAALWGYAALIADLVSHEVNRRVRWFLLALMVVTPPLFLVLTFALPTSQPGMAQLFLASLFLIGWPLRRWAVRRLGGSPYVG
jgi:uncharacterized membrane protein